MTSELSNNKIYQTVAEELKNSNIKILAPGLDGYEDSIKRWSEAAEKRAAAVVFPLTVEDVSLVVKVARANSIDFVVCCGRHSTGGASSIADGIVIDLGKMRKVAIDAEHKTIALQGGCTWADVDVAAAKHGLATVGGTVNHTGVGGLILGGGFGWLSSRYGLTIDNLLSAELVLADGSIVQASETTHQDLFWAIRGAGSSFAVCTEFVLRAFDQPDPVWAGLLAFAPDKLEDIVDFANKHHDNAQQDQCMMFGFSCPPPHFAPTILVVPFYNGTEEAGKKYFEDLFKLGPVLDQTSSMPYEQLNGTLNPAAEFGDRKSSGASAVKPPLDPKLVREVFTEFMQFVAEHEGMGASMVLFTIIPFKKISSVPLEAMAYANRGDYYNSELLMRWTNPEHDQKARAFNRRMNQKIRENGGAAKDAGVAAYPNNVEHQVNPTKVFGVNTERLMELKKMYDPDNVFRAWHNLRHVEAAEDMRS